MKEAPNSKELNASAQPNITTTSRKGRRAISSLWFAVRTLTGSRLTPDDISLISEALGDIQVILEVTR